MNQDLASLSEHDLAALIAKASQELESRRDAEKRETIAKIRELAKSIGADVKIHETGTPAVPEKRGRVPIKYRDPQYPEHAWSGRGVKPRWLQALLDQGLSIEEFRV